MPLSEKPELISFKLCPFVQRSVITLLEKGIEFDITYIDLKNKPDWFLKISPFGKVPVLKIGETVLFESAVINEFLDETHPPSIHPTNALRKAHNRAWIEFGSNLLFSQYKCMLAENQGQLVERKQAYLNDLQKVEEQLGEGPFFNGSDFSLVDTSFAPLFMRHQLLVDRFGFRLGADLPKCQRWSEAMLKRESVRNSVVAEFDDLFVDSAKDRPIAQAA